MRVSLVVIDTGFYFCSDERDSVEGRECCGKNRESSRQASSQSIIEIKCLRKRSKRKNKGTELFT